MIAPIFSKLARALRNPPFEKRLLALAKESITKCIQASIVQNNNPQWRGDALMLAKAKQRWLLRLIEFYFFFIFWYVGS